MGVFSETISLKDSVSPVAKKASAEFDILTKALAGTQSALVKANALGDTKKIEKLTQQSSKYTTALEGMAPAEAAAGEGAAGLMAELTAVTGGIAAVAAAAVVVVGAFAAVTLAGAKFAIEASEAKNAAISLFDALGEGQISGEQVDDMLDGLRAKLGVTKDALTPFTTGFLKLGITGQESLESLTRAAASAEALVKGGGEAFVDLTGKIDAAAEAGQKLTIAPKKLTGQLAALGLNVEDVARAMGITGKVLTEQLKAGTVDAKKFGDALTDAATGKGAGPLEKLANSSKNLGALLKEYIGDLFEDLGGDIAPFMAAVKDLFGIFESKTTPSGQALKAGIGGFFKEVFADATKVVPMVKHFLLDVVIYGLKAYIALKPIVQTVRDFGAMLLANQPLVDGFKTVLLGIAIVLGVLVAGAIVTAAAVAALVAVIVAIQVAIVLAGLAILGFVGEAGAALGDWIAGAATAAYDFVAGLVKGIGDGASQVVGAVKGLADSATSAFTDALGIASPSKVMMQLGGYAAAGAAIGIEDGAPDVHAASTNLADATVAGATPGPSAMAGGSTRSSTSNSITVIIQGAGQDIMTLSREALASAFEAAALGAGA